MFPTRIRIRYCGQRLCVRFCLDWSFLFEVLEVTGIIYYFGCVALHEFTFAVVLGTEWRAEPHRLPWDTLHEHHLPHVGWTVQILRARCDLCFFCVLFSAPSLIVCAHVRRGTTEPSGGCAYGTFSEWLCALLHFAVALMRICENACEPSFCRTPMRRSHLRNDALFGSQRAADQGVHKAQWLSRTCSVGSR